MRTSLTLLSLLAACDGSVKPVAVTDSGLPDTAGDSATRETADTTSNDTGTQDTADSGGTDTQDTAPPVPVVRFVALGDAGEGNATQYKVADAIGAVCANLGCDFALYLGDNFYDTGVADVDDAQFQEKFELPYANLDFRFYPVLGNHDYGGDGAGWELWKGQSYIDYTTRSDKWTFPDLYYAHEHEHVAFYGLDTTQLFWGIDEDQATWLREELATTDATWKIAYGHHPYTSNGPHGDAGNYEGLDWVPIVDGQNIKDFMDGEVCGEVDVYLCGHDHSLQWPRETCGTEFLVSGAGAKVTEIEGNDPTYFEENVPGFLWVELRGDQFTGIFYDEDGFELYRRVFNRR